MNGLIDSPKHKDLIYDVGMHKGEDTEFYLRKGFRVIGFEAHPDLADLCRARFEDSIRTGQLVIVEGAIIDPAARRSGQERVQFFRNNEDSVWGTACVSWVERNARLGTTSSQIEVDAIDFASTVQRHGVPHYMKIDIEGSDMVCIDVLRHFRKRPNFISIESDKTSFARIKREIETLVELGYDSFKAIEQSEIPSTQSCPYPSKEGNYAPQTFEKGSSGLFGAELGDDWKSKREILRQYRAIRLGYILLGDDGLMNRLKFRGAWRLRSALSGVLRFSTKAAVPGWYDTHARHSGID